MQSSLNNFKSKEGKLHVDKLKPVPSDLNKLSDVFDQEVVKMYDELVKKINTIDIVLDLKKKKIMIR